MISLASWAITIAIGASLVWLIFHAAKQFRDAQGSIWERLLAGFKDSATILLAGLTYAASAAIDIVGKIADALNAPEVAEVVRTQIPTQYVAYGMMVLAGAFFIARLRTLGNA